MENATIQICRPKNKREFDFAYQNKLLFRASELDLQKSDLFISSKKQNTLNLEIIIEELLLQLNRKMSINQIRKNFNIFNFSFFIAFSHDLARRHSRAKFNGFFS